MVDVDFANAHPRDFASFPVDRQLRFELEVYDAPRYEMGMWCHGDAGVARGIIAQGMWESYETRLALELCATNDPSLVLDFGCNMGWYTVIAALQGHDVVGFEMEPETAELCKRNMHRNGLEDRASVVTGFIDRYSAVDVHRDVLLLKSDVEGSEQDVVAACWGAISSGRVRFLILEISPCFDSGYGDLMARLMGVGYGAYRIPNKGQGRKAYAEDPIGVTLRNRIKDPHEFVGSIHQENVLMVCE